MRVDVVDRREVFDACVLERDLDGLHGAGAGGVGGRDVVGVCRGSIAGEFAVDLRAARTGVLLGFEDEHRGAFAHHESAAVSVEWTRGLFGTVVELRGERLHLHESAHGELEDRRLGAARHHHVGTSGTHEVERNAERVRGRGARGHDHLRGALRAECHGDVARRLVGDQFGDCERGKTVGTAVEERLPRLAGRLHAADAVADQRADAVHVRLVLVREAGVLPRLDGGGDAVDGERVHVARGLAVHVARLGEVGVEPLQLARDLAGAARGIELRDASDSARALLDRVPARDLSVSDRRDHADSRNDDFLHDLFPFKFLTCSLFTFTCSLHKYGHCMYVPA